jgi:hypothetical protein
MYCDLAEFRPHIPTTGRYANQVSGKIYFQCSRWGSNLQPSASEYVLEGAEKPEKPLIFRHFIVRRAKYKHLQRHAFLCEKLKTPLSNYCAESARRPIDSTRFTRTNLSVCNVDPRHDHEHRKSRTPCPMAPGNQNIIFAN